MTDSAQHTPDGPARADAREKRTPDLSDYLSLLRRRRRLLLFLCGPIVVIATALALGLPDVFVSTGLVRFSTATISGELPTAQPPKGKYFHDLYMIGLTGAILSPPVLSQLLREKPGLIHSGQTPQDAMEDISDRTRVKPVQIPILDPNTGKVRQVIEAFEISFRSRDPNIAQQVASWLTGAFIGGNRAGLRMRVESAQRFYDLTAAAYGRQINTQEARLARFKAAHLRELPEFAPETLGASNRTERDLDTVEAQLRSLRQQRVLLESELVRARTANLDQGLLASLMAEYRQRLATYGPDHPEVLSLESQIETLRSTGESADTLSPGAQLQAVKQSLTLLRQRYGEDHPDVRRMERQLTALQSRADPGAGAEPSTAQPEAAGDSAVARLTTQIKVTDLQSAELQRQESQLRSDLEALDHRTQETALLEHEYRNLTTGLEALQKKYAEMRDNALALSLTDAAIDSGRSDDLILVSAPNVPERATRPQRLLIFTAGLALALVLGLNALLVREMLDRKVRGPRDVHRILHRWPLIALPEFLDAERIKRRRWQAGIAATGTLLISGAAVITGHIMIH